MTNKKDISKLLLVGEDFMDIMRDYQECQEENPNFNPQQALHYLYADLTNLFNYHNNE